LLETNKIEKENFKFNNSIKKKDMISAANFANAHKKTSRQFAAQAATKS